MPVPSTFADISETASLNSPSGSEAVGPSANDYLNVAFAFIKQVYDGAIKPLAAFNMNGQKATNLAPATISSTSTDAVIGSQLYTAIKPVYGDLKLWWGTASQAAVAATHGPGWFICDGNNSTPNFLDRSLVAAGGSYATGTTGGATAIALSQYHLPTHSHVLHDPSHAHAVADPSHNHGVADNGHSHFTPLGGGASAAGTGANVTSQGYGGNTNYQTSVSGTGIGLYAAATGIAIYASGTGITMDNAGSGGAFDIRNPFCAVVIIMYTGAGVA